MLSDERHECGHTDADHEEIVDLEDLVENVQHVVNPRVALVLTDEGHLHFATTLPPHEAAEVLKQTADRIRYGGQQHLSTHWDRGQVARWN